MATADKKYLTDLAREVKKSLKAQRLSSPFVLNERFSTDETNSGGWMVELGTFRGYQCSITIWFDKFTSHEKRKIYYCVYSNNPKGITRLVAIAKPYLGDHISIYGQDWRKNSKIVQLSKPLHKKDFGKPVFERYSKQYTKQYSKSNKPEYLYGIYEFEKLGLKRNETRRKIERIVEFVVTINNALNKAKIREDADVYQKVENRRAVRSHLRRERNSHLVVMRKQLDDYRCQICGFDFSNMYGELGRDFAEAHHIVPLSKNEKKRNTGIDDLVTVCANCHRMLHRMKGNAGDIQRLKAIISKK